MTANESIDVAVVKLLRRFLPGFEPLAQVDSMTGAISSLSSIDLPVADGADYYFQLVFSPELQVHAKLLNNTTAKMYFWYMPFEDAAFKYSVEKQDAAFLETVENLLTNQTRIVQKKGWLFWHFRCEYELGGAWKNLGGTSCLRFSNFSVPGITGRRQIYRSLPIAKQLSG
jgi:hypothetical protein